MTFQTNYENNNSIIPEGEYECMIAGAFLNATNSKRPTEYFSVRFVVRNDVAQKYQNKNIFHAIWRKKPENRTKEDEAVDGFSYKQLMSLSRAAGLPNGKSYESLSELGADLKGKCVLVTVEHTEYQGKTRESVKWTNPTKHPDCHHVFKTKETEVSRTDTAAATVTTDDDLPF